MKSKKLLQVTCSIHLHNFCLLFSIRKNMMIILDCFGFDAIDNFDYFSFCIFIEKYNADDGLKHVLKEKVSHLSNYLDYVGNPLKYLYIQCKSGEGTSSTYILWHAWVVPRNRFSNTFPSVPKFCDILLYILLNLFLFSLLICTYICCIILEVSLVWINSYFTLGACSFSRKKKHLEKKIGVNEF